MSLPNNVIHVVFGGALPSGEVWESGFWTTDEGVTSNAEANALAELWWGVLLSNDSSGSLRITSGLIFSGGTTVTYVRVYVYTTGGAAAQYIGIYQGTPTSPVGAPTMPNQCAMVITLRTALAGRQHRGRMYLPCNKTTLAANSQLDNTVVDNIATAWALAFSDWNASTGNGIVSVVSRVGAGVAVPVTSVSVDTVVDTQRRRRNKVVAVHVGQGVLT